ncbi:uncharacterized protein EI90DRAFT_3133739 [Cantharellus anzutake]|uniref:uncharacterized protein n=1 Tax=Cantharellus anzutake TaxID=1750568 RepID=UPI0019031765|nr:uncharacterized protein EI90DRAFT_3133739 [Cantharellus anzutake]KAF8317779.1 hypothetical protein EI90DRAFT_3133739 [Cantharellus anzutake]
MPRGVPKDRPEEVAMKFTSFFIPPLINSKNASSGYLKNENQNVWARNALHGGAGGKRKRTPSEPEAPQPTLPSAEPEKRGLDVLIIHPGSRYLRVGRASDPNPISVPHVIGRKVKQLGDRLPEPSPCCVHRFNPSVSTSKRSVVPPEGAEPLPKEFKVEVDTEDEACLQLTDLKVGNIRWHLRSRMHKFGFKAIRDGSQQAAKYNKNAKPSALPNDPEANTTLSLEAGEEFVVFCIPESDLSSFSIRWPIRGSKFNTLLYRSRIEILSDIQIIWTSVLHDNLLIAPDSYRDYSVMLIVPDCWERVYVRDLANLLLIQMGFRRLCVQQESVCSSFGAGLGYACVVDIGATKTSVACVDEGLVLPETRLNLDFGGDDISEFFFFLLRRINLPFHLEGENLWRKLYYWNMIEDFKARSATLAEVCLRSPALYLPSKNPIQVDVDIIPYEIFLRPPGRTTQRCTLKVYDEPNVASMLLFHPDIVDFVAKHSSDNTLWIAKQVDDLGVLPEPTVSNGISNGPPNTGAGTTPPADSAQLETTEAPVVDSMAPVVPKVEEDAIPISSSKNKPPSTTPAAEDLVTISVEPGSKLQSSPIDIRMVSSHQPLDVAAFHSIRASSANPGPGGAERWKKMLSCVLVVGGTALTPGMLHALESRLKILVASNMPGLEDSVAVIPAPKEIDPRILAWKGAGVLAKLESLNDQWIQAGDWDVLEMRALKERSLFF